MSTSNQVIANSLARENPNGRSPSVAAVGTPAGRLILNADDWGRDWDTTERIFDCVRSMTLSSVSAMVFMEDSERSAELARKSGVDAGLHLNLTTPFTAPGITAELLERQRRVAVYLTRHRLARVIFHPGLDRSFDYVVKAQIDEFGRLYGAPPQRIDGHHHMHLCANVLWAGLLPDGIVVRRNFSFQAGQKSPSNRLYRTVIDHALARRHRVADYFFSLPPLQPEQRLQDIFSRAQRFIVEVETHPVNAEEYRFLTQQEIFRFTGDVAIAPRYELPLAAKARPLRVN
jgi:predicted glycoside hydrolase/deacetylase ChbG (UPF0249 family)